MLQITIIHEPKKVYIRDIRDMDTETAISSFDASKGTIELEPLVNHVGEKVLVTHLIRESECTKLDYEHVKTLTNIDKDENGIWFIEYT